MYQLKRFSQIQKEFVNVNPIKRIQIGARKLGRSWGNNLEKKIAKHDKDKKDYVDIFKSTMDDHVTNPNLEAKIKSEVAKRGGKVIPDHINDTSSVINIPRLKSSVKNKDEFNEILKDAPEIRKAIDEGKKYVINHTNDGTATLAHELGHIQNLEDGNLFKKSVSNLNYKFKPTRLKTKIDKDTKEVIEIGVRDKSGLLSAAGEFIKGKLAVKEEANATKSAMKTLKELGVNKSELRQASMELDTALRASKSGAKRNWRWILRNTVQTPAMKKNKGNDPQKWI